MRHDALVQLFTIGLLVNRTRLKMEALTLRTSITGILPTLSGETVEAVLAELDAIGVTNQNELTFIQEEDLKSVLKPIQIRKLLHAWKSEGMHLDILS